MKKFSCILKPLLCIALAAASVAVHAQGTFNPVNDDTDIFLANPSFNAQRPNVLIILDNTANWNTPFVNEKNALVTVVNSLTSSYNVGLAFFDESGGSNTDSHGTYIKFGIRQMTDTNKNALSSIVNGLDKLADKGNNNEVDLAMAEAYAYYLGKPAIHGFGQVKRDFAGNTANNPLAAGLPGNALANGTTSTYTSPIVDPCQKNFIIYISNGPANENSSALTEAQNYLSNLEGLGGGVPPVISISPSGQQGNWADEYAQFFANSDLSGTQSGSQNIITYTIEVDPTTTGQGPGMTALLQSMAVHGKGKYFGVTDAGAGAQIVQALNQIFQEVQAVNTVFAATTLPVSVNVRGTNLNQVYIGVFRPDAYLAPRWFGNLKLYDLQLNTSTNTVFLADANANPAENASTGFITGSALSFWTTGSSFWAYRDPSVNGVGGASDAPDGDLVEKGGVAEQLRIAFATDQSTRNLYTCTQGSFGNCANGSALNAFPFSTSNTDITAAALAINVNFLQSLTGYQTKAVTNLTDRLGVVLNNASSSAVSVTSIDNGGTTVAVSNLTTSVPKTVTTLDARVSGTGTVSISKVQKVSGSITITTATAHGFANGASVTISGSVSGVNGTWTISSVTSTTFVIGASGSPSCSANCGTVTGSALVNSTTAKASVAAHGYANGQSVTISGASPSAFNGTFNITVVDANTFTYVLSSAEGLATVASGYTAITASGNTTTATATTATNHGFSAGNSIVINGASPAGYNGSFTITSVPAANQFTYTVSTALAPNTGSPVYATKGGSTTATVTLAAIPVPAFSNGQSVTISGSNIAGYNGTFPISCSPSPCGTTFTYTPSASVLPNNPTGTIQASTGTQPLVTATTSGLHGFTNGQSVTISGSGSLDGTWTIANAGGNSFQFCTTGITSTTPIVTCNAGIPASAPTGSPTVRPATPVAYATVPNHGYGAAGSTVSGVLIAGGVPAAYNGTFTITILDANTFTYPLSSTPGPNTGNTVTSSIPTTTAIAVATNHGFTSGQSVQIAGATPNAFNGTFTVTVLDPNTFTYTLASAQGNASGAMTATATGGASSTERDNVINWVRGQDNFQDENLNASFTDIRASVHGDVLHSRPAVVNYNRRTGTAADTDVYVFYGSNDGMVHAVKGGFSSASGDPAAGSEVWGFVPQEFFPKLRRLRNNSPTISPFNKKPYFADGEINVYTLDHNGDGKIDTTVDPLDQALIFVSVRRGGRFLYALDVSSPLNPKLLWKVSNTTPGMEELGYTWSDPSVVSRTNATAGPVLIFGAGYDASVEDIPPTAIGTVATNSITTNTNVTQDYTANTTYNRSMGRGIFVLDALTGNVLFAASSQPAPSDFPASAVYLQVPGMTCSISSDVAVLRNRGGSVLNRAYVGDTCGNLWRLDFNDSNIANWTVTQIASIGNWSTTTGRRKFLFPPDVVYSNGFDALLIGSGDREHPFDTTVTNRMYMFEDQGTSTSPITGNVSTLPVQSPAGTVPVITESALFDATSNCVQDPSGCPAGTTPVTAQTQLASSSGWFITLGTGEKVVGNAVTLANTTFFNTNQPSATAGGGACGSNLGIAREYQVNFLNAAAANDLNPGGGLTTADRSQVHAGGGYLPSPVPVVVQIAGQTVQAVISGVSVQQAPGATLQSRLRKYWYKETE